MARRTDNLNPDMRVLASDYRRYWRHRREFRAIAAAYDDWRAANPKAPFATFYAVHKLDRMNGGAAHVAYGLGAPPEQRDRRTRNILEWLQSAGLEPGHLCVDYGCGSLWLGEALIDYLEPGGYIGMDVVDDFYVAALERLPTELAAAKRPDLHVISKDSLDAVRARAPDFIFCGSVLLHVPPHELGDFFTTLIALAAPHTRIIMTHQPGPWTRQFNTLTWRYSRRAIRRSLARFELEPVFHEFHGPSKMIEIVPKEASSAAQR